MSEAMFMLIYYAVGVIYATCFVSRCEGECGFVGVVVWLNIIWCWPVVFAVQSFGYLFGRGPA